MKTRYALIALLAVAGCMELHERVPADAKLMYYGPTENGLNLSLSEKQGGMLYVTRGGRDSILRAAFVGPKGQTNLGDLSIYGNVAVYWQPGPATTGPAAER